VFTVTGTGTSFTTQVLRNDLIFDASGTVFIGIVQSIPNNTTINLKVAGSRLTYGGSFSIRRPPQTASSSTIQDQAGNVITQTLKAGTYGNFCNPEPSSGVATASITTSNPTNTSIKADWTSVSGADHYLVFLKNNATINTPLTPVGNFPTVGSSGLEDGTYFPDDISMTADGLMALNVTSPTATFNGLNSGANYTVIVYPYTLDNNNIITGDRHAINYNTTSTAAPASLALGSPRKCHSYQARQ